LLNYLADRISVIDEMKRLISKYPKGFEGYEETLRVASPNMAGLEIRVRSPETSYKYNAHADYG